MKLLKQFIKNSLYAVQRNPISKNYYQREILRRSKLPMTSIEELSKHINMFAPFTSEIQPVNDWYGHASILKKFLGLPQSYQFKFVIEHGMYFSDQIADIEMEINLPSFLTYSPYRAKVFKKKGKHAYVIGPFIHYAKNYLDEMQLKTERKRLGKTILFFPFHSLVGLNNEYDMNLSVKKIKSIARGYKNIRVCIYWKDVLLGKHKFYQNKGLECVTAGHILDPFFLPRLKSIITNSDLTIANDTSTPLSYCTYMNKPQIIFLQRPKTGKNKYFNKIMQKYWSSKPYQEIVNEFSKINFSITQKQKKLLNLYCGMNRVKTKDKLLKIVEESEKIFQKSKNNS